jgi:hypothetical protein
MTDGARYVVRDHPTLGRRLWWAPPDGGAWDRLPLRANDAADEPVGARHVAEAILVHATGDFAAARENAVPFRTAALDDRLAGGADVELRAEVVQAWLALHDLPTAPGWGPLGPAPVVSHGRDATGCERYTVSLDGWELLHLTPHADEHRLRIDVVDLDAPEQTRWTGDVVIADLADGHRRFPDGRRVEAESLPFGGWAVQVDGFDVAIVERHATSPTCCRVAVYDRDLDAELQRFNEPVVYREPPTERLSVAERLARFQQAPALERVLGR